MAGFVAIEITSGDTQCWHDYLRIVKATLNRLWPHKILNRATALLESGRQLGNYEAAAQLRLNPYSAH